MATSYDQHHTSDCQRLFHTRFYSLEEKGHAVVSLNKGLARGLHWEFLNVPVDVGCACMVVLHNVTHHDTHTAPFDGSIEPVRGVSCTRDLTLLVTHI